MSWLLLSSLISSALAMSEPEYQAARSRLQQTQKETDRLLKRAGVTAGFFTPTEHEGSEERKAKPLFQLHTDLKSSRLNSGQLVFGQLITRLVVGSDGSPVLVEIDAGQGALSGVRAMGMARQSGTPGRLTIEFQRLVLKGGKAITVQATALDSEGSYGLVAQVFSQKAWGVAGAMASSFVSGLAASQQTLSPNAFGFSQAQPTGRNALLQGVAQTAADQSKRLIDEATAEKPVLVVDAATPVTILIQEEVRF
jgi:hypothetical protein